jgi:hypothetical protein
MLACLNGTGTTPGNYKQGKPMTSNIIEVWIAMNEAGDYEVAKDEDDVVDLWNENVGGLSRRLVRLRVTMSAPAVTEADVNVPEEAGQAVNVEID